MYVMYSVIKGFYSKNIYVKIITNLILKNFLREKIKKYKTF
ncbi:hypothetical protein CNEO4_1540012 [Clostridium neonatale]|uniref:Uncharacterized protein n=1 Tax=Clostridium neonatale TaxID=137838 RepID=A0AAD2DEN4_9CLOT|nr:hypothetical protein CNEO2_160083 [Clostridium neonatale]CAI3197532.1 hypothetical protein CNEO2_10066 [Clostridium neonatale]CAI3201372.1 hypothetical protein CNEO2_10118 [Clostridium neonatale]CAI3207510.1 hypothetical protein CNEO2_30066 [Clostridium neonatale]CAI3209560.1 hypothetical protein CNEO2_30188 [Clostridium neonatale]